MIGYPVNTVQDCVEDTVKDSARDERFCSFALANIPFKLITKFDNYSYKFVHHVTDIVYTESNRFLVHKQLIHGCIASSM